MPIRESRICKGFDLLPERMATGGIPPVDRDGSPSSCDRTTAPGSPGGPRLAAASGHDRRDRAADRQRPPAQARLARPGDRQAERRRRAGARPTRPGPAARTPGGAVPLALAFARAGPRACEATSSLVASLLSPDAAGPGAVSLALASPRDRAGRGRLHGGEGEPAGRRVRLDRLEPRARPAGSARRPGRPGRAARPLARG